METAARMVARAVLLSQTVTNCHKRSALKIERKECVMARHRLLVEQLIDVLSTALTKIYRQKKMLFGPKVCHEAFIFLMVIL